MEFWLLSGIITIIVIVLFICLEYLNHQVFQTKQLYTFSSNVHYPITSTAKPIFVENLNQCHPEALQTCTITDATTCLSCDTFSQCVHFAEDAEAIKNDGTKITIPKTEPGKGWCLPIINDNIKCNQYHGRKILNQNANHQWQITCECLRPGYIGNDNFSHSCETANICNGDVKLPLGPWETVTCNCPEGYTSARIDDVPTCVKDSITKHVYSALPMKTVDATVFNPTYSHNITSVKLPNPCVVCPITGVPVNGELRILNNGDAYCAGTDNTCLAVRLQPPDPITGTSTRVLNGTEGPDAVIALVWSKLIMYGTENDKMEYVVLFDTVNNDELANTLQLPEASTWAIKLDHVRFPEHFISNVQVKKVPLSTCVDSGFPTGGCTLTEVGEMLDKNFKIGTVTFNKPTPTEKPIIWGGGDAWNIWERWNPIAGLETGTDVDNGKIKPDRIVLNKKLHEINDWTSHVKVLYLVYDAEQEEIIYIRTNDINDWKKYIGAV